MSISTHVLDAVAGGPARGMPLRLERADGVLVGTGETDADGRCPDLTEGLELEGGIYRLCFDTGAWYAGRGTTTFYPTVELSFEVTDTAAHYHVPLLLSPFAYSTYRGS
jgi:5-hydroxyisourate hydrolase